MKNSKQATPDDIDEQKPDEPKRKKTKIRILYTLLIISIAAVTISAAGLGYELYINRQGQAYYSGLTSDIPTRERDPGQNRPSNTSTASSLSPGATDNGNKEDNAETGPREPEWTPYIDFEAANVSLPGITAWILLEGTSLDYPVMQTTNNSFFLGHLADGTKHRSGAIFLDYRNSADFSDRNSLIYGHESRTGEMFGILKNYRRQSYYDENPVMHLYTPEKDYELVLVAGYLVDSGIESPQIVFNDDAAFEAYVKAIKRKSMFKSDVEVNADDRIVSLCTCAYDYPNARFVVVGKLVELNSASAAEH